jgi:hypothetical protein
MAFAPTERAEIKTEGDQNLNFTVENRKAIKPCHKPNPTDLARDASRPCSPASV